MQSDLMRTLQATFQLSQKPSLWLEDCMLSFWSLCSRSLMYSSSVEELVLLKITRKTSIQLWFVSNFVLDSKIVAEADRLTLNGKEWQQRLGRIPQDQQ